MASHSGLPNQEETQPQDFEVRRAKFGFFRQPAFLASVRRIALLVAITILSILVHGYHMGTDDAAIYAPGIEKASDPSLFPRWVRNFSCTTRGFLCSRNWLRQ